jgi:hypothetical protein
MDAITNILNPELGDYVTADLKAREKANELLK